MIDWITNSKIPVGQNIVDIYEMATDIESWKRYGKNIVGCTSLPGDILHPGHISCLYDSRLQCDKLIVIVNDDDFLRRKKGLECIPHKERCQIISSIKGVDYVVPFSPSDPLDNTVCEALKILKPDKFFKGGDRCDMASIPEWGTCSEAGIQIVTGVGDTKTLSSSSMLESYFRRRLLLEIRKN